MQNLEQIRAAHALAFWKPAYEKLQQAAEADRRGDMPTAGRLRREVDDNYGGAAGGAAVSKLPSLIVGNGLLATLAFARSKGKGYEKLMLNVLAHLPSDGIAAMPAPAGRGNGDAPLDPALRKLSEGSSLLLQRASAEALAYLGYLKRFAP
jgi:CRISPR/Cas system CMR-associated protein Cmr5 small subunit